MHSVLAFVRRDALSAASYRVSMVLSLLSLLTLVVPVFLVTRAVQPVVGPTIRADGPQFFAYVVAGMAAYQFVLAAVTSFPNGVAQGIRNGTFEALLATPARFSTLLLGFNGYPFLWAAVRALTLLLAARLLGAEYDFARLGVAFAVCAAIAVSYLPFGILAAALLLFVRTAGPLPNAVLMGSMVLGGVYFPVTGIPWGLELLSRAVPLTYGLRAMRRTLAPGTPLAAIAGDLAVLLVLSAVLMWISVAVFRLALDHARRSGSLAQY